VYGRPAKREGCYENIKITKNAHDSHFCAANPKFVAVVTEVAGGGTFLVLPIHNVSEVVFVFLVYGKVSLNIAQDLMGG
jgi:coronin-2